MRNGKRWVFPLIGCLLLAGVCRAAETTGEISGKVIDSVTGEGAPDVDVTAEGGPALETPMTTTGLDGTFTLGPLPAGEYRLFVYSPAYELSRGIPVTVQKEPVRVELKVATRRAREAMGSISGKIQIHGKPPAEPLTLFLLAAGGEPVNALDTEPDGGYRFEEVAPGNYTLRVDLSAFSDSLPEKSVEVTPGQALQGIDFALTPKVEPELVRETAPVKPPSGSVRGEVRSKAGKPLRKVAVWVSRQEGKELQPVAEGSTGRDGRFEIQEIPEGVYTVEAASEYGMARQPSVRVTAGQAMKGIILSLAGTAEEALQEIPEYQRAAPLVEETDRLLKDPEEMRKQGAPLLEKELRSLSAVEGQVVDAEGKGVEAATVLLLDKAQEPVPDGVAETDSKGRFSIRGIADGTYTVLAVKFSPNRRGESEPVTVSKGRSAKPVRVILP